REAIQWLKDPVRYEHFNHLAVA
ncbi:MAG: hypothetical protein QOK07_1222, partial [Gemmatimonadaceae bacterium]|nr:hypothetical protein [Gemmatimonadaceae bacterium]